MSLVLNVVARWPAGRYRQSCARRPARPRAERDPKPGVPDVVSCRSSARCRGPAECRRRLRRQEVPDASTGATTLSRTARYSGVLDVEQIGVRVTEASRSCGQLHDAVHLDLMWLIAHDHRVGPDRVVGQLSRGAGREAELLRHVARGASSPEPRSGKAGADLDERTEGFARWRRPASSRPCRRCLRRADDEPTSAHPAVPSTIASAHSAVRRVTGTSWNHDIWIPVFPRRQLAAPVSTEDQSNV